MTSRSSLRVANAWGSRRVAPAADHVLGALLECARGMPQAPAFRFLGRRAELDTVFDYDELLCCVAGAAGRLREAGVEPGDRVLLLCPPGPEYVVSLFGCFYAGAIAVPAYPPQFNRPAERIVTLARDAAPRLALTTEPLAERLADLRLGVPIVPVSLARGDPSAVRPSAQDLALIQYTSGSTSTPRGVVLSHRNLVHNAALLREGTCGGPEDRVVAWLPPYHDMGLIGAIVTPVCSGMQAVLMTPSAFMRRPIGWLEAISQHRGTISVAPNFAYEMCVQRTTPEQRARLDLSSWRVALNGAERVHAETLERFSRAFAGAGFSSRAFTPCYGLAEATLGVASAKPDAAAVVRDFDPASLQAGQARRREPGQAGRTLVACGRPLAGVSVRVVDPETRSEVTEATVGEIWVAGPSVARGYWNQPEASAATFGATLEADPGTSYLRTGDLGFVHQGELFVTGRIKDLIVVLGANHYPEDIERTAEAAHPAVRARGVIAFASEVASREQLVVVVEIEKPATSPKEAVARAIREAVAREHGLPVFDLVLVAPGATPKTSSGKPRRQRCRARYEAGELERLAGALAPATDASAGRTERVAEVAAATACVLGVDGVGPEDDFFLLGGHSLMATQLASRLEALWGVEVPLRLVFEAPTPSRMAARFEELLPKAGGFRMERVDRSGPLPLTHSQERMWILHQLDPGGAAYNVSGALLIRGRLDAGRLERALRRCVERHETLRTRFVTRDGRPAVEILPQLALELPVIDVSGEADPKAAASRLGSALAHRPFDLEAGPLLRAALYRLGREGHAIVVSIHHIVSDAWSMGVLLSEVLEHYRGGAGDDALPWREDAPQYVDFAAWQRAWIETERFERELAHWRAHLEGAPTLELPTDRPRSASLGSAGDLEPMELPAELLAAVRELALAQAATPFMVMLTAFQVLLYRYTGQTDFVIGVPIANRNHAASEHLIGTLVNTLALRVRLRPEQTFEELLRATRESCLTAYEHQNLPFERLVAELHLERRPGQSPLVQVMFDYQNPPMPGGRAGELAMEPLFISRRASHFDFSLLILDTELGQVAGAEYRSELFDRATVRRMLEHYRALLEGAVFAPARAVSRMPRLPETERRALGELGTSSRSVPSPTETVVERIWQQARRAPDAPAVSDALQTLSYGALIEATRSVAAELARAGVGSGCRVAVCLGRSRFLPVALLAIHWLGAAYVPLDPDYPGERLRAMLEDAGPAAVIADATSRARVAQWGRAPLLTIEALLDGDGRPGDSVDRPSADPRSPAYVIYTSGSTGKPKGVTVTQRNVSNFLQSMAVEPGIDARDHVLSVTTISFDIAVLELLLPLTVGARVTLVSREVAMDGAELARAIDRAGATLMQATPSTWRMLLTSGWQGRWELTVLCGGEALPPALAEELTGKVRGLWNMYGPTETTVWSTIQRIDGGGGEIAIGRPIAGTSVYVLDPHGEIVPPGVAGELYIGGEGVAEGYFERPELTRERFLPDPFRPRPGGRMYRTGDLGRMTGAGVFYHLGRLDHQVKIRGHRIELGEIEATMRRVFELEACVVVARELSPGDARLVAYYVARGAGPPTADLKSGLAALLPGHMIPSFFVALEALPLTPNGKLDRKALPAPDVQASRDEAATVPPRTETERQVARLWAEVLGHAHPSIRDNFFDHGHSLLATTLFARIEKELGVSLPLASLFEGPTIEGIARRIDAIATAPEAAGQPFEFLVPIRRGGREPPLFCIHGAGGVVLNLERLARHLDTGQPFYGIQARGIDGRSPPHPTIEAMAEAYLAELCAVQPEGPYFLSGYCGGGIVAFEMAQRLARAGAEVAFLALIDTYRPGVKLAQPGRAARLLRKSAQGPWALLSHGRERLRERLAAEAERRVIARHLQEGRAVPHELRGSWLTASFLDAASRYTLQPFAGDLVVVRATDVSADLACQEPNLGWNDYVRGELELVETPGDHFSLAEEPHVRVLAAELKARITAALRRAGDPASRPPSRVRELSSNQDPGTAPTWSPPLPPAALGGDELRCRRRSR